MSQAHIFLAHANEDKEVVEKLYDRLKAQGYRPWLDKKDLIPGQNWREVIPEVIESSDIFIACLSNRSISKRGYVQQEFRMALIECAKRPPKSIFLIPVRLDDCEIPDLRNFDYGINLKDYHWLDYFESDGFERLEQAIIHQFGKLEPTAETTTIQDTHSSVLPNEEIDKRGKSIQNMSDESEPPSSVDQTPRKLSSFQQIKKNNLEKRLEVLVRQYEAASDQLNGSLSGADKVTINEQMKLIEKEISQVEDEIAELTS